MRSACVAVFALAGIGAGSASADYMVSATSNGMSSRTVQPGGSFDLDLVLTSDGADEINSAIVRLVFSEPGLRYDAYDWKLPFENGSITDDSTPLSPALPAVVDADTLSGLGYPNGVVDVELSNVVLTSDRFGQGTLVTLTLTVPLDYMGEETIVMTAIPDTLADGFTEIPSLPGTSFMLTIPATGGVAALGVAAAGLLGRRRR